MLISQSLCVWRALFSTLYSFSPVNVSKICLNSLKFSWSLQRCCVVIPCLYKVRDQPHVSSGVAHFVSRQSLRVGLCSLLISLWSLAGEPTGLSAFLHFPTTPVFQIPASWCTLRSLLIELSPPPKNPICSRFN